MKISIEILRSKPIISLMTSSYSLCDMVLSLLFYKIFPGPGPGLCDTAIDSGDSVAVRSISE